ncbi:MAG: hypothetical protein EPO26_06195 [Chloroflexota bacterium]|nr:MAG: hypothetical protein EPO26_06195 [Chloroflexota bacterium]
MGAVALGGMILVALAGCDRMAAGLADPEAAVAAARIKEGLGSQAAAAQGYTAQAAAAATFQAGGPGTAAERFGQLARAEGARLLGVPAEQANLDSVEAVQWADTSLGCPEAGKAYAQMMTPGFRAMVSVAGRQHRLHGDASGRMVLCTGPTP